jgi:hypothetical protein
MKIVRTVANCILKNYEVESCETTPEELTMADHGFGRVVDKEVWLRFKPIRS